MAYTYDFKDNVVYGADDINAVRASILTRGVIEESDSSCKAVLVEEGVKILGGQAVFEDGCRILVDDEGVVREKVDGERNYIYLYNNTLAGVCEVVSATTVPSGDCVLIAEIDAEGNIFDKRQFAQLKTVDAERYAASFSANLPFTDEIKSGEIIGTVTLPKSGCSFIEFNMSISGNAYIAVKLFPKENNYVIWNLERGPAYSGYTVNTNVYGKYRNLKFEVSGNLMNVKMDYISANDSAAHTFEIVGVCMR